MDDLVCRQNLAKIQQEAQSMAAQGAHAGFFHSTILNHRDLRRR